MEEILDRHLNVVSHCVEESNAFHPFAADCVLMLLTLCLPPAQNNAVQLIWILS